MMDMEETPEGVFDDREQGSALPQVPTYLKYTIGIDEAARYYGIGSKKLRQIVADNPLGDFYLEIDRHLLLKRRQFEKFMDDASSL